MTGFHSNISKNSYENLSRTMGILSIRSKSRMHELLLKLKKHLTCYCEENTTRKIKHRIISISNIWYIVQPECGGERKKWKNYFRNSFNILCAVRSFYIYIQQNMNEKNILIVCLQCAQSKYNCSLHIQVKHIKFLYRHYTLHSSIRTSNMWMCVSFRS